MNTDLTGTSINIGLNLVIALIFYLGTLATLSKISQEEGTRAAVLAAIAVISMGAAMMFLFWRGQ